MMITTTEEIKNGMKKVTARRIIAEEEIRKLLNMNPGEDIVAVDWYPGNDILAIKTEEYQFADAPVAQLERADGYEPSGCEFESCQECENHLPV